MMHVGLSAPFMQASPYKSPYVYKSAPVDLTHWYVGLAGTGRDTFASVGANNEARSWHVTDPLQFSDPWRGLLKGQCVTTTDKLIATGGVGKVCVQPFDAVQPDILEGHTGQVYAVAANDVCVASGGADKTARVWSRNPINMSIVCAATLAGHDRSIIALALAGSTLFTASSDQTIRVWDIENASETGGALCGHTDQVNCLTVAGGLLYSGARDHTVRVWDLRLSAPCVGIWAGHREQVTCSAMTSEGLVTGSDDRTVCVWDGHGGSSEVDRHNDRVWSLTVLDEGTLVTGSASELHVLPRTSLLTVLRS